MDQPADLGGQRRWGDGKVKGEAMRCDVMRCEGLGPGLGFG
jgi:hypothetical protein